MMDRPAIKPLEWAGSPEWKTGEFVTEWFVFSVAGHYRLWHDDTVTPAVWHVSYPVGSEQPYEGTEHPNIEEAKAAAQSDYASRIRSCLLDKPEAVEGVTWPNGCDKTAVEALRYLSRNERPQNGEQRFNWAHLNQIADELEEMASRTLYMRPADTDAAQSEIDRLRRELEEARRALEPFATAVEKADASAAARGFAHSFDAYAPEWSFTFGQLRAARAALRAGEGGYIDSHSRDALIAGALQRADAREALFPEMSSRIKAEREQARRQAFEEAAELIEANIIKDSSAGKFLAPRQEGNRDGLHYAAAIRQRAEEKP
ncbi:hypothetical protein [Sinorhizobium meliloti]|uniref:hypothetical protein n=1 Tax=Rhizobium meliloti TaxID=382 RepID=UPI00299DE095